MRQCASEICQRRRRWWSRGTSGVVVDGAWVCSRACVETIVRDRLATGLSSADGVSRGRGVRLGALLRHHRACAPEQIEQALAAQGESRLRLGEQLRTMGAVGPHDVLRALAAQAGVSYLAAVDVSTVREAPGGLSRDLLRVLGVVPLGQPIGDRLRVAFPAPVPRASLTALWQITGWATEPYLVGDDEWQRLLDHYGAGLRPSAAAGPAFVHAGSLDDLVRHVADAVTAVSEATVRDARWARALWVRVETAGTTTDVVCSEASAVDAGDAVHDGSTKEDPWPAASMSR